MHRCTATFLEAPLSLASLLSCVPLYGTHAECSFIKFTSLCSRMSCCLSLIIFWPQVKALPNLLGTRFSQNEKKIGQGVRLFTTLVHSLPPVSEHQCGMFYCSLRELLPLSSSGNSTFVLGNSASQTEKIFPPCNTVPSFIC